MLVIIGYLVVLGAVFGGFALAGGHLAALLQPLELLMITGGAAGAFLVGNNAKAIKATLKDLPKILKGSKYNKDSYMELMALLYELLGKVRKEGLMSIEGDVEEPEESPIFAKYPQVLQDHHAIEFMTDYLRIMVSGNLNSMEIENLMDVEIDTHHHEAMISSHVIAKLGDGMPAFGIVAAVIAHALVGTFLGILLAYGFVGPLATLLEQKAEEGTKMLQTIKVTLLANLNGYAPAMAVEFGRKVLNSTERPGFLELEAHVKQKR
jgi:chemotaxis protein MotA